MQINVNVCEWVEVVMRNEDGPSLPLLTCESSIWKNQIEKIWGSRLVWWLWLHVESLLIYTTIQHISVTKKCNIFVSYNGSTLAENNDSWKKIKEKSLLLPDICVLQVVHNPIYDQLHFVGVSKVRSMLHHISVGQVWMKKSFFMFSYAQWLFFCSCCKYQISVTEY